MRCLSVSSALAWAGQHRLSNLGYLWWLVAVGIQEEVDILLPDKQMLGLILYRILSVAVW